MTFKEYLEKYNHIDEDAMIAAPAPASDGVVDASHGTTAADVLGKCDHDSHGGFFKKGCFHIPKPVFKQPLSRLDKKKRKKFVLFEVEMPNAAKAILTKITENELIEFIADNYDISYYDIYEIADVAWVYDTQTFFIKFFETTKSMYAIRFVEFKILDGKLVPENKGSIPTKAKNQLKMFKQKYPLTKHKFYICWK